MMIPVINSNIDIANCGPATILSDTVKSKYTEPKYLSNSVIFNLSFFSWPLL